MLGRLKISRNGSDLELLPSRKVRALFAYLALALSAVGRSNLCELLWDVPNDPRGELRWCLSKLRTVLDEPGRQRVVASSDTIALDLSDCFVDVIEIAGAARKGIETLDVHRLRALSSLFVGDFLDGLEIDRSSQFERWLAAQRRRFRACHAAVLEHLVKNLPSDSDETLPLLEKWVELVPFDGRAHVMFLDALAARGQTGECEKHLIATARLFEAEDLDFSPIRNAWRVIGDGGAGVSRSAEAAISISPVSLIAGPETGRRASLAVMPFQSDGSSVRGGLADGLTHDIITRLAKLRSLFIIASGSVFALAERNVGPEDVARRLNLDYVVTGTVRREVSRFIVTVEVIETHTARIVWTETFEHKPDDAFMVLDEIGNRIVSSIAGEIETIEKNRAILKPPNSLDSWEAYHRGLWHMYRFTKADNEQARQFFEMSIRLDPTFSRPHAGLSFTHWQNAFQHWADRQKEADKAYEAAGRSLIADDHDPAAHWAMGRALWMRDRHEESLSELERAVDLSPNFALGHYALAFVHSQSGNPQAAIGSADHSRQLSPFDPLLFGMLGSKALAYVRLGQFDEAANWAIKAAARPNAHVIIQVIAAYCLALAGRIAEAQIFLSAVHKTHPQYSVDDFLATFNFTDQAAALFRQGARRIDTD
ncbi:tetratricopeptide repeat protein [Mesorhizobium sp. J18]|uniref:tetratricopeptide repeat protein n=1 Tax=Mesorhizobium sp. J18 TaxID=935263 RepID=UPI0011A0F028|nr:tetratricopeptide repeat protein [Mesorhizobium sp. J18]